MLEAASLSELILMETTFLLSAGSLFLGWRLIRARRERISLASHLAMLRRRQVSSFLTRELVHTREIAGQTRSPQAMRLLRLRRQWLEAEQIALEAEGEEKSDYAAIERIGPRIFRIIDEQSRTAITRRHRPGTSSGSTGKTPGELLARAKTIIVLQKEIIAKLKAKVASTAHTQPAGDTAATWAGSLALAHQNTELQYSSLEKLERGLDGAQQHYRRASDELALQQTKARDRTGPAADQSLLIIQTLSSTNIESAKAFLSEMEDAHRESAAELRLMRDTNARQRKLIFELEKQLATLKSLPEEQQSSEELLKSLKAQLREYETCTATLELETEHLRAKIKVLNELIISAEQHGQVNVVDKLSNAQRDSDTAAHVLNRQQQAEDQLAIIARADTIERAVPAILNWLELHDLDCAVLVRGTSEKQYWFSTDAAPIDRSVRQLLQSLVPTADSFWAETKSGRIFTGSVLRICVQNPVSESHDQHQAKDDLTAPLLIIDALLRSLTETGNSGRNLAASLGKHLDAAVNQHKFLLDETLRIADQLHEELSQYLCDLQLTLVQKQCLDALVEDFKSDLHLLARAGGSVDHALKTAKLALTPQRLM